MPENDLTATSHTWAPIADLNDDDLAVASAELPPLATVWREQYASLADDHAVRTFHARLRREWAIETGIIERLYSLDRGVTTELIEQGIDASLIPNDATDQPPERVANIIRDQESVVEALFDHVAGRRELTVGFVKELHAVLTQNQEVTTAMDQFGRTVTVPLRRGAFKWEPNNPTRPDGTVHEYCPPEHVDSEMERLLAMHHAHGARGVAPEVRAAWLHHRFTQIHPFQDGNGRIARALASLVFLVENWFPLVITRDDRRQYLDALETADRGSLERLVTLFAQRQRQAFVHALGVAREVTKEGQRLEQQLAAVSEKFAHRDTASRAETQRAKELARQMRSRAHDRFQHVASQLADALRAPQGGRHVFVDDATDDDQTRKRWHRHQIKEAAKELDYFAGLRDFACWVRLCIDTESGRSEILLALHEIGHEYRGVVGGSVSFYRRQEISDGARQVVDLQAVSEDVFQVNYREEHDPVAERFDAWLDRALVRALDAWQRGE